MATDTKSTEEYLAEQGAAHAGLCAALSSAPRPAVRLNESDIAEWMVDYMDWFFKVRAAALAKAS